MAYYRIGWGLIQGATALLVFLGNELVFRASSRGALRKWLRAMVSENTVIDQVRESSVHVLGIHFRIFDAAGLLLILGILNVIFGWLILRFPYRARWIGMIVFGIGFLVGIGSVLVHPTVIRCLLTVLDLVFFSYFAWILPRSLLPAVVPVIVPPQIDKNEKDA